ncbi:unnamed protein product, partial [Ixodes pacificus]
MFSYPLRIPLILSPFQSCLGILLFADASALRAPCKWCQELRSHRTAGGGGPSLGAACRPVAPSASSSVSRLCSWSWLPLPAMLRRGWSAHTSSYSSLVARESELASSSMPALLRTL